MEKRVHGLCLILNNEVYIKGPPRKGSQTDVATLTTLFSELGFEIILKENLTLSDMDSTLKEFTEDTRHEASEMCVIISLSHGRLGQLQMVDGTTVRFCRNYLRRTLLLKKVLSLVQHRGVVQTFQQSQLSGTAKQAKIFRPASLSRGRI